MNDGLLPDSPSLGIIHVVALIEHHSLNISEQIIMLIRFCVQHVPEDLRGHHHD